jgi:hypothetical protein
MWGSGAMKTTGDLRDRVAKARHIETDEEGVA